MLRWVRHNRPSSILEVGVRYGRTAERLINAAINVEPSTSYTGVDLFKEAYAESIARREISQEPESSQWVQRRLESRFPSADISLIQGDSIAVLPELKASSFDLIFIDGGHSYETCLQDILNAQRLIAPGGAIFLDDFTDFWGSTYGGVGVNMALRDSHSSDWKLSVGRIWDSFPKDWGTYRITVAKMERV